MIARFVRWLLRRIEARIAASRERRIIEACGCIAYCPGCGDPLQDQSIVTPDADCRVYEMVCQRCGWLSRWLFDAPVPILLPEART